MANEGEENSSHIVISNILCYATTARHVMRADDIVRTCLAFYSPDDVIKGKDLLFNNVGEKIKRRRNDNRILHEIQDILELIKKCDDGDIRLPTYVADSYCGLPPTSGFDVVASHMIELNEQLTALRKEIEVLKESRVNDNIDLKNNTIVQEDLLTIKSEIRKLNHKLMGENLRRSSLLLASADVGDAEASSTFDAAGDRLIAGASVMNEGEACGRMPSDVQRVFPQAFLGMASPSAPPGSQEGLLCLASPVVPSMSRDVVLDADVTGEICNGMHLDIQDPSMDRLLHDEGASPTAPSFSQVCKNSIGSAANCSSSIKIKSVGNPYVKDIQERSMDRLLHDGGGFPTAPSLSQACTNSIGSVNYNSSVKTHNAPSVNVNMEKRPSLQGNSFGSKVDEKMRFMEVKKRRKNKRIIGSQKSSALLKSAVRSADLYVGNCDLSVTEDRLSDYIYNQINARIEKCQELDAKYDHYRSFKVTLNITDREKLLDSKFWPEGIVCRKYYNPQNQSDS